MNEIWDFILFLFASALAQNIVLATGFGSSMLLRIIRRPKDIGLFSLVLSLFAVLTVAIAYPIDKIIGIGFWAKLSRPLIIVGIALILYSVITPIAAKAAPRLYARVGKLFPLAAFNNLVIGVALICNHSFSLSLVGAIGLAIGCCVGFVVLSYLTAEGIERVDNPDIPSAFRGLPIIFVYVGLMALAVMGFSSSVSFI